MKLTSRNACTFGSSAGNYGLCNFLFARQILLLALFELNLKARHLLSSIEVSLHAASYWMCQYVPEYVLAAVRTTWLLSGDDKSRRERRWEA